MLVHFLRNFAECWFIIRRLSDLFAQPTFIHLHRHPFDVIRSGAKLLGDTLQFRGVDIDEASLAKGVESEYAHVHEEVLCAMREVGAQSQLRVSYESLMDQTRATLQRVCDGLGVAFDEAVLNPYTSEANVTLHAKRGGKSGIQTSDPKLFQRKAIGARQPTPVKDPLEAYGSCLSARTRDIAAALGYTLPERPLRTLGGWGEGASSTTLVVCVPGSDEKASSFDALASALHQRGQHVVGLVFDESTPRDSFQTQASHFSGEVVAFAQLRMCTACVVVGYSSGSALGHELAMCLQQSLTTHLMLVDRNPWNVTEPIEPPPGWAEKLAAGARAPSWPQAQLMQQYQPLQTFAGDTLAVRTPRRSTPSHVSSSIEVSGATHWDILEQTMFVNACVEAVGAVQSGSLLSSIARTPLQPGAAPRPLQPGTAPHPSQLGRAPLRNAGAAA